MSDAEKTLLEKGLGDLIRANECSYLRKPRNITVKMREGGINALLFLYVDKNTGDITFSFSEDGLYCQRYIIGMLKGHWKSLHYNCSHIVSLVLDDGREFASSIPIDYKNLFPKAN